MGTYLANYPDSPVRRTTARSLYHMDSLHVAASTLPALMRMPTGGVAACISLTPPKALELSQHYKTWIVDWTMDWSFATKMSYLSSWFTA